MKNKLIAVLCCIVSIFFCLNLTSCSNNDIAETEDDKTYETEITEINLSDIYVGYKYNVYPTCEFDYQVSEDCVVHINNISIEITSINNIEDGDLLTEWFYRYTFKITGSGYTDASFYGTKFFLYITGGTASYSAAAYVEDDGTLSFEEERNINILPSYFIFSRISE